MIYNCHMGSKKENPKKDYRAREFPLVYIWELSMSRIYFKYQNVLDIPY